MKNTYTRKTRLSAQKHEKILNLKKGRLKLFRSTQQKAMSIFIEICRSSKTGTYENEQRGPHHRRKISNSK